MSDITDVSRVVMVSPTNQQLCDELKGRIKILKEATKGKCGGDSTILIDDIDSLVLEVTDRLLTKVFYQDNKKKIKGD